MRHVLPEGRVGHERSHGVTGLGAVGDLGQGACGQQAVGGRLYAHMGIARRDRQARDAAARRNCEAFGAPVIGFVLIHKDFMPFAALDAGIMLQTLFLSAKAHGVDSCPLGVLATWRRPFDAEFEAPSDYRLITGFALGYASEAPVNDFRAERRPVRLVPSRS